MLLSVVPLHPHWQFRVCIYIPRRMRVLISIRRWLYKLVSFRRALLVLIIAACIYLTLYVFIIASLSKHEVCKESKLNEFDLQRKAIELKVAKKLERGYKTSTGKTVLPPVELETEAKWVEVTSNVLLFSAYVDNLSNDEILKIHAIGVMLREEDLKENSLVCVLATSLRELASSSVMTISYVPEHHKKNYTAVIITCQFPQTFNISEANKLQFTIFNNEKSSDQKFVSVFSPSKDQRATQDSSVALCVRPLFGPFTSTLALAEFIAYYHLMKVDKFYFYRNNASAEVMVFLNLLREETNIQIELLNWNMPLNDEQIHSQGQMANIQDCLFRARQHFKYVIFADLDEFILPQVHPDLKALIAHLESTSGSNVGAYLISSILYCKEFPSKVHIAKERVPLMLEFWHMRQKTPWPTPYRSKFIGRSDAIWIAGIHSIWEYRNSQYSASVSSSIALVNHYRVCCGIQQSYFFSLLTFSVLQDAVVEDNGMQHFVSNIIDSPVIYLYKTIMKNQYDMIKNPLNSLL